MASTSRQLQLEEHDAPSPASSSSSEYSPSGETSKRQRKRLKLSKAQITALEAIYEKQSQTPSTARRKELAEELQIAERQIRFWFQNRRAKDKTAASASRRSSRVSTASSSVSPASSKASRSKPSRGLFSTAPLLTPAPEPPAPSRVDDSPPPLAQGYDTELQDHLDESSPITILPVEHLCIGNWKRIRLPEDRLALVSYVSPSRESLVWFVHCAERAFKMEVPFSTIIESSFNETSPGVGEVVFILSRPPIFYYKASLDPVPISPTSTGGEGCKKIGGWGTCADWTENRQGTQNLLHRFSGDAAPLANLVRTVHDSHTSREAHRQPIPATPAVRHAPSTIALPQLGSPFAMEEQGKTVAKPALQINTAASVASSRQRAQMAQMVPRSAPAYAPTGVFAYCDSVPDPRAQYQEQAAYHAPVPVKMGQPPILYQASDAGSSAAFNSATQGPVMASLTTQEHLQEPPENQWHGHPSTQVPSGMSGQYAEGGEPSSYGAYSNYEVVGPHNPAYDANYTSSYPTPVSARAMMDETGSFAHYPTSAAGQFNTNQNCSSQNNNYYYTDPNIAYANEPTYPSQADYNSQPQSTYYPDNTSLYAAAAPYHGPQATTPSYPDSTQYASHYGYPPPTY